MGTGFYGSNDPTNSVKSTEGTECANRFDMQQHGSLMSVEVKLHGNVLHTIRYADGIRRELLQSLEIRRIPWADWMVSAQFLLDTCSQCHIDRGRSETSLSRNMVELIAQTMNEVGIATGGPRLTFALT